MALLAREHSPGRIHQASVWSVRGVLAFVATGVSSCGMSALEGGGPDASMFADFFLPTPDLAASDRAIGDLQPSPDMAAHCPGFARIVDLPLGHSAGGSDDVAIGDLNRDGKLDIAASTPLGFVVFLGDGQGGFGSASYFPAGMFLGAVAIADVDGDGILDLLGVDVNGDALVTARGRGDGTFDAPRSFQAGPQPGSVAAGDLNRDGKLDAVVANHDSFSQLQIKTVSVFLGTGKGDFAQAVAVPVAAVHPDSARLADLNGDGNLDVAVTTASAMVGVASPLSVLLGKGDGTFKAPATYPFAAAAGGDLDILDLNHDGKLDIVAALGDVGSGKVGILLGKGDGTFDGPRYAPVAGAEMDGIVAADFDGDHNLDVAVTSIPLSTLYILHGDGQGGFRPPTSCPLGDGLNGIRAADLNGDGKVDLAIANEGRPFVTVLFGQ
jgi:VCBS repeat protein